MILVIFHPSAYKLKALLSLAQQIRSSREIAAYHFSSLGIPRGLKGTSAANAMMALRITYAC
jgi:hypothetical protein